MNIIQLFYVVLQVLVGQVGAKLGQVGPSWGQVGAKLGLCWHILAGSWQSQRKVTHMSPKIIKDGPKEPNIAFKTLILERFWASCWHPKSVKK